MRLRDLHWVFVPWSAFLFALGGWAVKSIRRVGIPLTGALLAKASGIPLWRCMSYAVLTFAVFTLPYSPDRQSWLAIGLVGASYGTTPLILMKWDGTRDVWWHFVAPVVSAVSMCWLLWLTLTFNWFPHKLFEVGVGGLHGLWVALAVQEWQQERG